MVKTHGLTHISLAVRDLDRALTFYAAVFGVREYYRDDKQIRVQRPGPCALFGNKASTERNA